MGWIFFKPRYERLELIDRADLDNDPGKSPPLAPDLHPLIPAGSRASATQVLP